jgi:hypothetical protein
MDLWFVFLITRLRSCPEPQDDFHFSSTNLNKEPIHQLDKSRTHFLRRKNFGSQFASVNRDPSLAQSLTFDWRKNQLGLSSDAGVHPNSTSDVTTADARPQA